MIHSLARSLDNSGRMVNARDIVDGKKGSGFAGGFMSSLGLNVNWGSLRTRFRTFASKSFEWGQMGYSLSCQVGWYVVTTAMITALPLVFEYNREIQVEEMEKLQVQDAIEKGANPMQLAQQGLSSAVEPKVLK